MFISKGIILKLKFVFGIFILSLIISCATPYFGYTENQWNKLTALEQNKIKKQYSNIIASRETAKYQNKLTKIEQTTVRHGQGSHVEWQNEQ